MKLFIANASLQNMQFHYRIKEQDKRRTLEIPPMSQTALADDLLPEDLDGIKLQHEPYGFLDVADLKAGREPKVRTAILYSIDGPVPGNRIEQLYNINRGHLDEFGKKLRKEAAIVTNNVLNNTLDAQRNQGLEAQVSEVEVTVQEEEPDRGYGEQKPIAEGFVLTDEPGPDNKPTTSRRRGR